MKPSTDEIKPSRCSLLHYTLTISLHYLPVVMLQGKDFIYIYIILEKIHTTHSWNSKNDSLWSLNWNNIIDMVIFTTLYPLWCKAPITQNSTSKSCTRSYENLVDVVVSGNFWSILAWPCFVRGMAVGGCSTAEALPNHCLSTAQGLPKHGKFHLSVMSR